MTARMEASYTTDAAEIDRETRYGELQVRLRERDALLDRLTRSQCDAKAEVNITLTRAEVEIIASLVADSIYGIKHAIGIVLRDAKEAREAKEQLSKGILCAPGADGIFYSPREPLHDFAQDVDDVDVEPAKITWPDGLSVAVKILKLKVSECEGAAREWLIKLRMKLVQRCNSGRPPEEQRQIAEEDWRWDEFVKSVLGPYVRLDLSGLLRS